MVYERKTYKGGGGGLEPPKPPSPSGSAPVMCVAIAALRNENKGGKNAFHILPPPASLQIWW